MNDATLPEVGPFGLNIGDDLHGREPIDNPIFRPLFRYCCSDAGFGGQGTVGRTTVGDLGQTADLFGR